MRRMGSIGLAASILAILAILVGCAPRELPRGKGAVWHLVIIGDSSLWGVGEPLASKIEEDVGVEVVLDDFWQPTLSAGEVLAALQTDESQNLRLKQLPDSLKDAEVVVLFVNPLESIDPAHPLDMWACFMPPGPTTCDPASFEKYQSDLETIWAEIFKLRKGQPTILWATDIYNPLVGYWDRQGAFDACDQCWTNMSIAARLAADAYKIPFLERYAAFNGPGHNQDPVEKGYIRSDGEHLSELGAEYVAEMLSQLGYEPVSPP